jgi:hypothetical protein
MKGEWNELLRTGNPARSQRLTDFVRQVLADCDAYGVEVRKAPLTLRSELTRIIEELARQRAHSTESEHLKFSLLIAFLVTVWVSSMRGADVARLHVYGVVALPHKAGFFLDPNRTKVSRNRLMGDASSNSNKPILPVDTEKWLNAPLSLAEYNEELRAFLAKQTQNLSSEHFLFPDIDHLGNVNLVKPFDHPLVNPILKRTLADLNMFGGQTLHGFRGANAIQQAMENGLTAKEAFGRSDWSTESIASSYYGLMDVFAHLSATNDRFKSLSRAEREAAFREASQKNTTVLDVASTSLVMEQQIIPRKVRME